jgi:hypothetical protein
MARRALVAGDLVAAVEHRPGRQRHIADRLDQRGALRCGVLLPHQQYVVVWSGRASEAKTAKRVLLVGLPGDKLGMPGDKRYHCLERVRVRPSAVRLWDNPQERRRRYLIEAAAKLAGRLDTTKRKR